MEKVQALLAEAKAELVKLEADGDHYFTELHAKFNELAAKVNEEVDKL